jgi:hypothetical protein
MLELALLLFVAAALAAWTDHRHVLGIAVDHCRRACDGAGLQFLDDTVALHRVRPARDANGVLRLRRHFTFDYSTPAGERRHGAIAMLGRRPLALELDDREVFDDPRA